ncbi:hypothetical protein [Peribacillus sp. SCS-155]|uniref:hypothetical protein n=1 Tax=Peribacillus sedimenti TaxID=3115297 RepID=UPI0039067BD9
MSDFQEKNTNHLHELKTKRSMLQFVFPFALSQKPKNDITESLKKEGFTFFKLKDLDLQEEFYGGVKVFHRELEKFFLPNVEPILFPAEDTEREGFRRFSKKLNLQGTFKSPQLDTDFTINSLDIFLCPFHIGMMNIRIALPENLKYSDVLHFGNTFRVMEPIVEDEQHTSVGLKDKKMHNQVKDLIYSELAPMLKDYIDQMKADSSYFGSLPFFIDERMYVIGHIALEEDSQITKGDLFRAGQLSGYDEAGKPFVGANSDEYINRYFKKRVYDRWGDETYYVFSEYSFTSITRADDKKEAQIARQMYGQNYYGLLLFFYYKIVLLKLTHEHAAVDIEKDQSDTELLIVMITEFSAKFLFAEVNSTYSGKEMFHMVKDVFNIDTLYNDVKKTLASLYQNQEKISSKRSSYLLQILTIYTVISGIFGMNLVIEDWKGKTRWGKVPDYSMFEYISFFTALSGIVISLILGFFALKNWMKEQKSRKKQLF